MDFIFLVVQTKNVSNTDYIVKIFKKQIDAEIWVIHNCNQFGDCISPTTGNFLKPPSYKDYISGKWFYYFQNGFPALRIEKTNIH